jgi:hypothetical protein
MGSMEKAFVGSDRLINRMSYWHHQFEVAIQDFFQRGYFRGTWVPGFATVQASIIYVHLIYIQLDF